MFRMTSVHGFVVAGLPHSLALASIDAVFAVHAAKIIFLIGARSPAGPYALVVTSRCGSAVGLRSRRCDNRSVKRALEGPQQNPSASAEVRSPTSDHVTLGSQRVRFLTA